MSTIIDQNIEPGALSAESCWRATLARDARFDGVFVYAVRSTGIYCRPSCPSRRPRQEQVRFFARPDEAERAGFRPCQRCQPRGTAPSVELVRRACRVLEAHLDRPLTLHELGAELGVSPYHVQRTFKRVTGISPRQYVEALRLGRLKELLRDGDDVTSALYDAGYGSSSRLYERSTHQLGMTPGAYRRGGAGMQVNYTIVETRLGRMLVGMTERGVCAVSLGDDDAELEAFLAREFPAAEIARDDTAHADWVQALVRHLDGREPHLDLPLDVQGTAFQWRVWEALRAIPYGETRSYGQIAQAIGAPGAAQAVASACANNPAAIAIPCHRVVRGDGTSGGYRWGATRKTELLNQEKRLLAASTT